MGFLARRQSRTDTLPRRQPKFVDRLDMIQMRYKFGPKRKETSPKAMKPILCGALSVHEADCKPDAILIFLFNHLEIQGKYNRRSIVDVGLVNGCCATRLNRTRVGLRRRPAAGVRHQGVRP
jgi:hypothetical protein